MNFEQTDDRRMLSDSLSRLLADACDPKTRNAVAYTAPYHSQALWTKLVELGALYALAGPAQGGFGGGGFDIATVFEALGTALCPEPVLPALMAARLLTHAGADLEPLLSGAVTYAVAIGELDSWDLAEIETTARNGTLTGRKSVVYGGQVAAAILVVARDGDRLSLYEVAAKEAQIIPYAMIDGGGAAEVLLDNTKAEVLIKNAQSTLQDALDAGIVALCSEAVGMMAVTYQITVDYLKNRKQFGRSIGSFQVLQHRAVDMLTEIEQSRSITIKADSELGGPNASRYASMAKNMIGRSARLIAEEAIQMHGGIGMTDAFDMGFFMKRARVAQEWLGDYGYHAEKIAQAKGY